MVQFFPQCLLENLALQNDKTLIALIDPKYRKNDTEFQEHRDYNPNNSLFLGRDLIALPTTYSLPHYGQGLDYLNGKWWKLRCQCRSILHKYCGRDLLAVHKPCHLPYGRKSQSLDFPVSQAFRAEQQTDLANQTHAQCDMHCFQVPHTPKRWAFSLPSLPHQPLEPRVKEDWHGHKVEGAWRNKPRSFISWSS